MSAWWALAPAVVAWTVFCFVVAVLAHFRINKAMDKIEALRTPEIQRIEVVELRPQDCLIVTIAGHLTPEEAQHMNYAIAERFGTNRILVQDGGGAAKAEIFRGLR